MEQDPSTHKHPQTSKMTECLWAFLGMCFSARELNSILKSTKGVKPYYSTTVKLVDVKTVNEAYYFRKNLHELTEKYSSNCVRIYIDEEEGFMNILTETLVLTLNNKDKVTIKPVIIDGTDEITGFKITMKCENREWAKTQVEAALDIFENKEFKLNGKDVFIGQTIKGYIDTKNTKRNWFIRHKGAIIAGGVAGVTTGLLIWKFGIIGLKIAGKGALGACAGTGVGTVVFVGALWWGW